MPEYCNLHNAQFALGELATPDTLNLIRNAAGVEKYRREVPDGMYNLLPNPNRIRVLVNERNEIIELICG